MGDFDFLTTVPPPICKKRKQDLSKPIIVILLIVACLLLAAIFLKQFGASTTSTGKSALLEERITKEEWKSRLAKLEKLHPHIPGDFVKQGPIPKTEIYEVFGKPVRTQTINGEMYWYWKCSDGLIQAVILEDRYRNKDEVWLDINDY